jgi:hypothetical protein
VIGGRGAAGQLLHREPHPGNVLTTKSGPLFIDLETCCRGPVEFDLAHAPEEVSEHYPDVNQGLLRECRILVLAMITTWHWDCGDQLPNGRQLGTEWLGQIRAALDRNPQAPQADRGPSRWPLQLPVNIGHYEDAFAKVDGKWLLARRSAGDEREPGVGAPLRQ